MRPVRVVVKCGFTAERGIGCDDRQPDAKLADACPIVIDLTHYVTQQPQQAGLLAGWIIARESQEHARVRRSAGRPPLQHCVSRKAVMCAP